MTRLFEICLPGTINAQFSDKVDVESKIGNGHGLVTFDANDALTRDDFCQEMSNPRSPIFIIGTQRSGTTLLCRMLTSHPNIFIQNELNVRKIFHPGLSNQSVEDAIRQLIHTYHGISLEELLRRTGKSVWGLKDPELTGHLEELDTCFPNSLFLLIVRDSRAVVNSYIKNRWGLGTNAYSGALRWKREVAIQLSFQNENPTKVHLVRFEDLVAEPEAELTKIAGFLDLPYDARMLEYDSAPAFYHRTRENKHTSEKPNKKLAEKWRTQLSTHQKRVIESETAHLMKMLEYPLENKPIVLGSVQKFFYKLHQRLVGEIQLQLKWRIGRVRARKNLKRYRKSLLQSDSRSK